MKRYRAGIGTSRNVEATLMARISRAPFIAFVIALVASLVLAAVPARAETSCSVISGYLFTDFGFLASDKPVANCSTDVPVGAFNLNLWGQTGEDTEWSEIDAIVSAPKLTLGPIDLGVSGGVYYLPEQDHWTILTASASASTSVAGFDLGALYQWYWEGLEDERFQLSAGRTFRLWEGVSLDLSGGRSWIQSGGEPNFAVIGTPITMNGYTIRPFVKGTWGEHEVNGVDIIHDEAVFGFTATF